ncbi:hypothetical protein V8E54_009195 [Elaphomyces granulatus]
MQRGKTQTNPAILCTELSQSRHRSSEKQRQLHTSTKNKPNWPPLRPLIPASDLSLEPLLDDQIYLIRSFSTSSLCKTYVSCLSSLPLITTTTTTTAAAGKPKKGEAVRVNDRFQIHDADFAESLWSSTALKQLLLNNNDNDNGMAALWGGRPLGLNPNIRIYRYIQGQFFARHYDESNTLHFSSPSPMNSETTNHTIPIPARTTWTLLIYLMATEGGETDSLTTPTTERSSKTAIAVAPEVGMALLYRHGERCTACYIHEGKEVRKGEKWVIRTLVIY